MPVATRNVNCNLLENDAGFEPCAGQWLPDNFCHGSTAEQCTCSNMLYLIWAACDACGQKPLNTTWNDYSGFASDIFFCSGLPQPLPPPLPTGKKSFPSWALLMVSATPKPTIFDLAAASAFAVGPPPTPTPSPRPPPITSSTSQFSTTAKPSGVSTPVPTTTSASTLETSAKNVTTSASIPSASSVLSSSQGLAPSHAQTVPSLSDVTSVSSGSSPPSTSISSQQAQLSVHRNSFPAGAIAGIVVGLCLMLVLALFCLRWRRRARLQTAYDVSPSSIITPYAETSSAGAWDSDAQILPARVDTPSDISKAGAWNVTEVPLLPNRRRPQTETQAAQATMDLDGELVPDGLNARVLSTFSTAPDPGLVLQLRAMTARIRELEAQIEPPQSPSTPPPGYSGDGRSARVSR